MLLEVVTEAGPEWHGLIILFHGLHLTCSPCSLLHAIDFYGARLFCDAATALGREHDRSPRDSSQRDNSQPTAHSVVNSQPRQLTVSSTHSETSHSRDNSQPPQLTARQFTAIPRSAAGSEHSAEPRHTARPPVAGALSRNEGWGRLPSLRQWTGNCGQQNYCVLYRNFLSTIDCVIIPQFGNSWMVFLSSRQWWSSVWRGKMQAMRLRRRGGSMKIRTSDFVPYSGRLRP